MSRLPTIFSVPQENMDWLTKKVASMNKKAVKFGVGGVELVVVGATADELPNGEVQVFRQIAIEGEEPKIAGWRFVARLDHNVDPTGGSNIVYGMPGRNLPTPYRTLPSNCEHCRYTRKRRDTFILEEEATGKLFQVGRTCITDFLGEGDPERFAKYAEWLCLIVDAANQAVSRKIELADRRPIRLKPFLSQVSASIRTDGWVSGTDAYNSFGKTSTKERALAAMYNMLPVTAADEAEADAAIAWALTQDPGYSDFMHNVVVIAKTSYLDLSMAGTAAAIVAAYQRHVLRAQRAQNKSDYVGKIGERLDADVKVESVKDYPGDYGPRRLVKMFDGTGNLLVTWSSGQFKPQAGDTVRIRGTVKSHALFAGVKETILSHVKVN